MQTKLSTGLALHLSERLRAIRRRYRKRLARSREKYSESAVHKLRIETRRLLALLDLLGALRVAGDRGKLRRTVKKRFDWFDELRDTQVQLRLLKPMWRDFPEARRLRRLVARREARLVARLGRKLKAARLPRLNRRLKQMERELRPRSGFASASAAGSQAAAALQASFRRADLMRRRVRRDNTETIHRLRIAFKQFRYMSELLLPVAPWLSPRRLKWMKAYQDLAGNIQDLEVLLARVALAVKKRELGAQDVRRLRRELSQHRRKAITAFLTRIDDLFEFQPPTIERTGQAT